MKLNNLLIYGTGILAVLMVFGCKKREGKEDEPLFTRMPESVTHADFVNKLDYNEQLKKKFNIYTYRNFYNGGGVGLGDINNDGLIDIFMTSNMEENVLYLNKGNFEFEDISEKAGIQGHGEWSTGVSITDVNGDGWQDVYVCNSGNVAGDNRHNELYINNGDLTFTEKAEEYGINDGGFSTHGAFFDYDKDGDLDLYLLNNSFKAIGSFNLEHNQRLERDTVGGDKLFRNEGNRFTDVSDSAGIYGSVIGFGLGVTVGDINQDGWMDIYVSNDFFERDYAYINNQDGTFTEKLTDMMRSISAASMGADMADINNDHYPEIFVTDMIPGHNERLKTKTTFDSWDSYWSNYKNGYHHQFTRNMLHLNNANGTFSEIGRMAGVYATDWSWGALIMDLDNDGLKDIFVANGIYKDLTDQDYIQYFSNRDMVMKIVQGNDIDYKTLIDAIPSVKISSYSFRNKGNFQFENTASEWGLDTPSFSNGSAYGDLDNDGDMDLVVSNVNMPMFIYRNETSEIKPEHRYLKVVLQGKEGNTNAIGSKITAIHDGEYFYLEQMPVRGFKSTVDSRPNLGLGNIEVLDSLVVEWPDQKVTILTDVPTNQTLTLKQEEASGFTLDVVEPAGRKNEYFREITDEINIDFKHTESEFNDFKREALIYHMKSTEGPRMCKGDVDGDGLKDIYVGGAKGQPGALLKQQPDGTFMPVKNEAFEADKISEDIDCAMFDADQDNDLDLYVASGSNEFPSSSSALSDRLYFNNGKGQFTKSSQVLPAGKYENTSCVRAEDFDNDGVVELFVGARLKPFLYGIPVDGYLLENDGTGSFTNVTSQIAPELKDVGMIHDMLWEDVDGDRDKDIILAGDWMPLKIFINDKGSFSEEKKAFGSDSTNGWWNCLTAGDIDNDGDVDFVAGNHGLNSRFKATPEKPVSMYVNDFDMNGSVEQIICTYDGDKSYPLALKHDLTRQLPGLVRKYTTYELYKDQQVADIFPKEKLKNSIRLDVNMLETSLFINDGNGKFTRKSLPAEVQFSPVFAIDIADYNADGNLDILLGGNLYKVKPEVGRYDASYGSFLMGDGQGNFKHVPSRLSGFLLTGEIRDIMRIDGQSGEKILVSRSNGPLQVFEKKDDGK